LQEIIETKFASMRYVKNAEMICQVLVLTRSRFAKRAHTASKHKCFTDV